eukprot:Trichotokara_eunicae@DN6322_c0_g1_i3.p1
MEGTKMTAELREATKVIAELREELAALRAEKAGKITDDQHQITFALREKKIVLPEKEKFTHDKNLDEFVTYFEGKCEAEAIPKNECLKILLIVFPSLYGHIL